MGSDHCSFSHNNLLTNLFGKGLHINGAEKPHDVRKIIFGGGASEHKKCEV